MGLKYPSKVVLGDISVRDGLQHEERFIPTRAKLWLAERLILAGFKRIEVTNFGNPKGMPQFADADELMVSHWQNIGRWRRNTFNWLTTTV